LEISPGFHLAQENQMDLSLPPAERNVPWAFSFHYWIHEKARAGLEKLIKNLSGKMTNEGAIKMINQFLRDFPEVEALLPTLFARGDLAARQFAQMICTTANRQDLTELLKQFALSQDGSMKLRQEAALELYKRGFLESKRIRLWDGQEWRDLILLAFELTDEPSYDHSPQAERLLMQATLLLQQGKAEEAEPLLLKAIELEPEAPDLKNNLCATYELQGRTKESYALARELFENYPDYLFGRINMAKLYIKDRKLDEAREILDEIMLIDKMHLLEFGSLCQAQLEFALVKKESVVAESWLNLWENMDPDHPGIEPMRMRIQQPNLLKRLLRGLS
jgi:tetratricopeptide (TPR) repeat protein